MSESFQLKLSSGKKGYILIAQQKLDILNSYNMILNLESNILKTGKLIIGLELENSLKLPNIKTRFYGEDISIHQWVQMYNDETGIYSLYWHDEKSDICNANIIYNTINTLTPGIHDFVESIPSNAGYEIPIEYYLIGNNFQEIKSTSGYTDDKEFYLPYNIYNEKNGRKGIAISGGGSIILGSGDSAYAASALLPADANETWITSDNSIKFYTGASPIEDRYGVILDKDGNFYPENPSTGSLGSESHPWKKLYVDAVVGNIETATKLAHGRYIGIINGNGEQIGTPTFFDGSENINIPLTEIDASCLEGTANIDITGSAESSNKDGLGQDISKTYITDIGVDETNTMFIKKGDGTTKGLNLALNINSIPVSTLNEILVI